MPVQKHKITLQNINAHCEHTKCQCKSIKSHSKTLEHIPNMQNASAKASNHIAKH